MKLIANRDFRLGSRALMTELGACIPSRVLDLLRIGVGLYAADRRVRRDRSHWDGPSRNMSVTLAVSEPDFWGSETITNLLVSALELLSGDAVFLSFSPHRKKTEFQHSFLEPWERVDVVSLYSGGLDSAAGLAAQIRRDDGLSRVTVTARHQSSQREIVQKQLKSLSEITGRHTPAFFVKTNLIGAPRMSEQERTQRCRGFLFMSLAGVVAAQLGASTVEVFENGIGALNLPPMAGMSLSGRSTKNSHPGFVRMMSELVSVIADRPIEYVLPFQNLTKAELVSEMRENSELEDVARSTVSCVHFPRRAVAKQCGVCPGCLGRRQALRLAGIDDPSSAYEYDIFGSSEVFDRIPEDKLDYLKATLMDVQKLESLSSHQVPTRIGSHIFGTGVAQPGESIDSWMDLLSRYREEWRELAVRANESGTRWGSWFRLFESLKRGAA